MFEKFAQSTALENTQKTALNLLSQKGEANARSIASKFVSQFKLLDKAQQLQFLNFFPNNSALTLLPCFKLHKAIQKTRTMRT